jgi:hypothetical protein
MTNMARPSPTSSETDRAESALARLIDPYCHKADGKAALLGSVVGPWLEGNS